MLHKLKAAESGYKLHDSYCRKLILEFMHAMHATGHVCVHSYLTVIIATLRLAVQNSCDLQFAKLAKGEIKEFGLKFFITRLPLNCQSSTYSLTTSIPMLTKDVPSLEMYLYIDILIPRPTLLLFHSFTHI